MIKPQNVQRNELVYCHFLNLTLCSTKQETNHVNNKLIILDEVLILRVMGENKLVNM